MKPYISYDEIMQQIEKAEREALDCFDYAVYFMLGLMKNFVDSMEKYHFEGGELEARERTPEEEQLDAECAALWERNVLK